jgi:hypothetical protein
MILQPRSPSHSMLSGHDRALSKVCFGPDIVAKGFCTIRASKDDSSGANAQC